MPVTYRSSLVWGAVGGLPDVCAMRCPGDVAEAEARKRRYRNGKMVQLGNSGKNLGGRTGESWREMPAGDKATGGRFCASTRPFSLS